MRLFKIITGLFLFTAFNIKAQEGTDAAGGEATGSGGTVSYSVGQADYITASGIAGTISQGLQQPYEIFVITGIEYKNIEFNYSVYPNPTVDFAVLTVGNADFTNMSYGLFDAQSKLIAGEKLNGTNTVVSMEKLAMAAYFLKVTDNNKVVKTFKIIKY